MKDLISSAQNALDQGNLYGALYMCLTLPDICAKLDNPSEKSSNKRCVKWFNDYLKEKYEGFLEAEDFYALRCSALHEGSDKISHQSVSKVLEHFIFLAEGPHCNVFINVNNESFLQLNVRKFCTDILEAVNKWLSDNTSNEEIQNKLKETISIHPPGTVRNGIRFGNAE